MKLSSNGKVLASLLAVFVVCDILLSPVGFETRGPAILGNASSIPWFALLIAGLVLNIIALLALFFRPRTGSILAIIGSIVYIAVIIGDQAGLVISITPPTAITAVEIVTLIVLFAALFYARRVYMEKKAVKNDTSTK